MALAVMFASGNVRETSKPTLAKISGKRIYFFNGGRRYTERFDFLGQYETPAEK